eukprot:sb/3464446/
MVSNNHRWLLYTLICVVVVVATRYLATLYRNVAITKDVPMPQESNFATANDPTFGARKNTFTFIDKLKDLLANSSETKIIIIAVFVNEMIEELWLTSGYWGFTLDPPMDMESRYDSLIRDTICCFLGIALAKNFCRVFRVVSGFAFNFAHVIGETKIIIIAVFVNEMIEELWLTSGYWGFTLDPPMDMESRYDSLIRDTICCFLGIALAKNFCRVFRVEPVLKAPIIMDWNVNNPHSIARFLKLLVQGVTLWQITLIYNSDLGPFHFNITNVLLVIAYTGIIGVICIWNINDFPDCSRHHVIAWHVGWAAFSGLVFLFTIYPMLNSAMYLIAMVESVAMIALYWIDLAVRYRWYNMDKLIFGATIKSNKSNGSLLPEIDDKVSIKHYREAIQQLENHGVKSVSVEDLKNKAVSMTTTNSQQQGASLQVTVLKTFLRLIVIGIAWMEPFLWQGAQYRRHCLYIYN